VIRLSLSLAYMVLRAGLYLAGLHHLYNNQCKYYLNEIVISIQSMRTPSSRSGCVVIVDPIFVYLHRLDFEELD